MPVTATHKRTGDVVPAWLDDDGLWLNDLDTGWGIGYAWNKNDWVIT